MVPQIRRLDEKAMVKFKIYTSQTGQQINTVHLLPNIGNQEIKFGQLTKYSVRNIFLQKSCRNEVGRLVPDLFVFFEKLYIR